MSEHYYSIVEYLGQNKGHHCGYCNDPNNLSISHGMWAHHLDTHDYLELIESGWRRSGRYCYRPCMQLTCCPQYTLRLRASSFEMSKRQKKVMKRFRAFVNEGKHDKRDTEDSNDGNSNVEMRGEGWQSLESVSKRVNATSRVIVKMERDDRVENAVSEKSVLNVSKEKSPDVKESDETKGSKKAKVLRRERAKARLKDAFKAGEQRDREKHLEDFIKINEDKLATQRHKFSIRTVLAREGDALFDSTLSESHAVYVKYQTTVHKDTVNECNLKQFLRFLCNSSLSQQRLGSEFTLGAYHQHYLIDNRIVMVGVVDLLPTGLSSVYLYYDPDFAFLSPGTLSALFEIAFVRQIQRGIKSDFDQYYMGFYIHSCPKMRYKANFKPSQILCPFTLQWQDIEKARPFLDESKCARLRHDVPSVVVTDDDGDDLRVANNALVLLGGHRILRFEHYCRIRDVSKREKCQVTQYARLVGAEVAKRMLLYRKDDGNDEEDDEDESD